MLIRMNYTVVRKEDISLNIQDLKRYEKKLMDMIEHTQKELAAVRVLIEGMAMRNDIIHKGISYTIAPSIPKAVFETIRFFDHKWFTVRDIINRLIESGFRSPDYIMNQRPNISNYLSDLSEEGKLERENKGSETRPIFRYRKV